MDTQRSSSYKVQMNYPGIKAVLTSAVLEWFLIFLLYINALFSYLVTKFARSFKLQTPCLLCSRLDHVVGDAKPGFYRDLICGSHKSEISSLVFCNVHNKIADVHGLCEGCLFSFATENKSNSETFRLLVGKLGTDLIEDTNLLHFSSEKQCTCCTEPFSSRLYTQNLLRTKSIEPEVTELEDPLPRSVGKSRLHIRKGLKKKRVKSRSMKSSKVGSQGFDPLSHVGYTEVKITSDSESEVPLSDDDGSDLVREKHGLKEELVAQCIEPEPRTSNPENSPIILSDDLAPEKLIHQDSMPEPSILFADVQLNVGKPHDVTSVVDIGHGLEELNWHQEQNPNPSVLSKLISLNEVPPSPDFKEAVVEVSGETLAVKETGEREEACKLESGLTTEIEPELKKDRVLNGTGPTTPRLMDLSDAYKLAVSNKGSQVSSIFVEQLTAKDSVKFNDDLKLLLSQLSAARGLDLPLSDMSPRVHGNAEELKISDASSSIGLQILQKRISLERNESGLSVDGSIVSEIEGESVVDRLKRQVEYDRKSMNALYKELEEERNASAIAANQAMAMITRLQEEKATLHMEALQYLRMMEEQSEYDVEALQKTNDLLSVREKEIQDLEAELEVYKRKCETMEKIQEAVCDMNGGGMRVEGSGVSCNENDINASSYSPRSKNSEGSNKHEKNYVKYEGKDMKIAEDSMVDFEKERLYISQCLEKLERKLHLFSNNGGYVDVPNGGYSGKETHEVNDLEQIDCEENHHFDGQESSKGKQTDLVSLVNEVSDLNERLKLLEADRNFLEHTINSLRNGDEGVRFIQEIAHHLQELRGMGIRREQPLL
ncbi:Zein-binding domain [Macleaya cordata]|uniref:Zein-binding domain n=1 Tax=Macleaya cordata TaxID=56857 RepID=A0A200QW39_MACCD|nr:Zein-binding domain [Macleaya cordata]